MDKVYNGFYLAIGKQGGGKTALITKLMYDTWIDTERKVFSNYNLFNIPHELITFDNQREEDKGKIDILKMLDDDSDYFNNSILLLDEIHVYFDSLDFMKKNNRRIQKFFSQLRKRNILLLGTTQYLLNVDVRLRRQCMNVFEMENIKKDIFKLSVHDIDGYYSTFKNSYLLDLSSYFNLYDTHEIIE